MSVKCYATDGTNTSGCTCLETRHSITPELAEEELSEILQEAVFVMAFPQCRHICISGARWWKRKRAKNPHFQQEEIDRITQLYRALKRSRKPFALFLPQTPLLKELDQHTPELVSPHQFGGYIDSDTPLNPVSTDIPDRDAYKKRTSLFLGNGAVMPLPNPVKPITESIKTKSGHKTVSPLFKSRKTHVIRSVPPLGLCTAIARSNLHIL